MKIFVYRVDSEEENCSNYLIYYPDYIPERRWKLIGVGKCPTKKVTYRILNNSCAKTTHFTCIGQSKFENASFTFTLVQCYRVEE